MFILFRSLDSRVSGVAEPKTRLAVVLSRESCGGDSAASGRQECSQIP